MSDGVRVATAPKGEASDSVHRESHRAVMLPCYSTEKRMVYRSPNGEQGPGVGPHQSPMPHFGGLFLEMRMGSTKWGMERHRFPQSVEIQER